MEPGSVWITPRGDWRLAGFEFCVPLPQVQHVLVVFDPPVSLLQFIARQITGQSVPHGLEYSSFGSEKPVEGVPTLSFASPDVVLTKQADARSDVFSVGRHRASLDPVNHQLKPLSACMTPITARVAYEIHRSIDAKAFTPRVFRDPNEYSRYVRGTSDLFRRSQRDDNPIHHSQANRIFAATGLPWRTTCPSGIRSGSMEIVYHFHWAFMSHTLCFMGRRRFDLC